MYLHKRLEENVRTYKKLLAEWRKQMEALTEIRWHGRGGQGAKTAALLLAEAAFNIGKHVQGFPEYGPERMGAPITGLAMVKSVYIPIYTNRIMWR